MFLLDLRKNINSSDEEPTIPRRTLNRYKKGSKTLKKGQLENNWSRDFNCSTSSEDGRPNDDVHSSYGEMVSSSASEGNCSGNTAAADSTVERESDDSGPPSEEPSSPSSSSETDSDVPADDEAAFQADETLNEPLFQGSQVTKAEVILMVMTFVMRHCLSTAAMVDLLHIINSILGRVVIPASKYVFEKLFKSNFLNLSFHFYCSYCLSFVRTWQGVNVGVVSCPHCQRDCNVGNMQNSNFFITSSLKHQIKTLFEREDITVNLAYRYNRHKKQEGNLEDIFDGEIYKNLEEVHNFPNNFTYTFNTDGMPVFKSASYSLWPIYIMINELPPSLRMKNLLLAGVWFGQKGPRMNIFLEKFVREARILADDGVEWENEGEIIRSKFYGICCCADAPARAALQNRLQFNGYMGCGLCYHPGRAVERVVKYPVDVCDHAERCDDEVLEDMVKALDEGRIIRGVKGPTPVINLPKFPLVWGFPPDFMHCLLLGVARQLAELWFSSPANSVYYIGQPNVLNRLDKILKSIKVPSFVSRMPRPITERKHWKAIEWYNWLFYFSIPCLHGVLPEQYLRHFYALVQGCYILLQKSLSPEDVNTADILLFNFVGHMQLLYGEKAMTSNVHSLVHLAKSVKMWGPLWTHSCFPFETANGEIKNVLKGNRGIMLQAMYKFFLVRALPLFGANYMVSDRIKAFCKEMLSPRKLKPTEFMDSVELYGAGSVQLLSNAEQNALLVNELEVVNEAVVYKRLGKDGIIYHSQQYTKATRRNCTMFYLSNGQVGRIQKVLCIQNECIILYKMMHFVPDNGFQDPQNNTDVFHIKLCAHLSENVSAIAATELCGSCFLVDVGERSFICFPASYVAL
ncbi:uncharacterized protein [Apostichopus japonicus]|uniref:uncharacterized protein n=1 Tax=Stichopus japonicus TaxID=307972 RepID=UPI003AB20D28